jgi:hypothetical protein
MTAPTPENRPVSNWPTITEKQWYTLAIVAVIFTCISAVFAIFLVLSEPDIDRQAKIVAVMAPFGTIPIAIITFCTVAWRGMVTSRQADQQRLQADQQRRQNDATDDANYAKLLQEGAKLLADDKTTNQMAGVASLSILLNEPKARYRLEAIDVLAETVKAMFKHDVDAAQAREIGASSLFTAINSQLRKQANEGVFSTVSITLKEKADIDPKIRVTWPPVSGFAQCIIERGKITKNADFIAANKTVSFSGAIITQQKIDIAKDNYSFCIFDRCKILYLDDFNVDVLENKFVDCDFSNCSFEDDVTPDLLRKSQFIRPWFDVRYPPIHNEFTDWSEVLEAQIDTEIGWELLDSLSGDEPYLTDEERVVVRDFHGR